MKSTIFKTIKHTAALCFIAGLLFVPLTGQAQEPLPQEQQINEDFSEGELKQFIEANKVVADIQMTTQEKMATAIEEEGLDINKFNEILTSHQNPNAETQATEEEMNQFDAAVGKVMQIQQDMQMEVQEAIENQGMSIQKYDEILIAYQQSPKVQQNVNRLLEKDAGLQGGEQE